MGNMPGFIFSIYQNKVKNKIDILKNSTVLIFCPAA